MWTVECVLVAGGTLCNSQFGINFFFNLILVVQAISLLGAQILELIAAMILLQSTAKPQYKFSNFFKPSKLSKERSWLLASAVGFGFLLVLVILTSFLADRFIGPKVGILNLSAFFFAFFFSLFFIPFSFKI